MVPQPDAQLGRRAFVAGGLSALAACATTAKREPPYIVVLGEAQDGGLPHLGCRADHCERARRNPALRKRVACLGLVTRERAFLVDATPDLPSQAHDLPRFDGVLLTHAHIGHYTGLMHLGREVMAAKAIPVWATARMRDFLSKNGPWDQLVKLGQIDLRSADAPFDLDGVRIEPLVVPHRDEYTDTVGYRIGSALYIPDIDKWEKWDRDVADEVAQSSVALLDGTFASIDELPGRKIEEVRHPLITESAARLAAHADRVRFIHLNHTNPALWGALSVAPFNVARDGDVFPL